MCSSRASLGSSLVPLRSSVVVPDAMCARVSEAVKFIYYTYLFGTNVNLCVCVCVGTDFFCALRMRCAYLLKRNHTHTHIYACWFRILRIELRAAAAQPASQAVLWNFNGSQHPGRRRGSDVVAAAAAVNRPSTHTHTYTHYHINKWYVDDDDDDHADDDDGMLLLLMLRSAAMMVVVFLFIMCADIFSAMEFDYHIFVYIMLCVRVCMYFCLVIVFFLLN